MSIYVLLQNKDKATRSVIDDTRTPIPISADATKTGLSPEFHLAFLRMGKAGSFFRPPDFFPAADLLSTNQSVNNHRSKVREDEGKEDVDSSSFCGADAANFVGGDDNNNESSSSTKV
jgi:hypothetical protein